MCTTRSTHNLHTRYTHMTQMGANFIDRLEAEPKLRAAALQYHVVPGGARFVPAGFKTDEARARGALHLCCRRCAPALSVAQVRKL